MTTIVIFCAAFAGVPLATLVHELGHAFAAAYCDKRNITVSVGRPDTVMRFRLGSIDLALSPIGAGGLCRWPSNPSRRDAFIIALAGPLASLVMALLLWRVAIGALGAWHAALLSIAGVAAAGVLNLVPFHSRRNLITRGLASDGLVALCALRGRPIPAPPRSARSGGSGLRREISGGEAAIMLAYAAVQIIAAAHHAGNEVFVFCLAVSAQQALSAKGHQPRVSASPAAKLPRARAAPGEPMKGCPKCAAEVRLAADLCFCYHRF